MMTWKRFCLLAGLLTSVILALPALADEGKPPEKPWQKFRISLGGSLLTVNSDVRLGVSGIGIGISPEDLFNVDSGTAVFRADGYWRFSKNRKHRLDFTYFSYKRTGETILGRDIDLGEIQLPLGTEVSTELKLDVFKVGYSYSFFQDERIDLAFGAGLYILPIKYDLTASGVLNVDQAESITAPLPVFGFRADFAITPKWLLRNNLDLFYLSISDYEGSIINGRLGIEYNPFKHVGFGLAAEVLNLHVEAQKGTDVPGVDFNGMVDIGQVGLNAYISFFF